MANSPSWLRYADNLVHLVPDVSVGQQVLSTVNSLLGTSGLSLKGADGVVDLSVRRSTAELLGFQIRRTYKGELSHRPGRQAMSELGKLLVEAHGSASPERTAQQILLGWIQAYGPACQRQELISAKLMNLASQHGFREVSRNSIEHAVQKSWTQWQRLLKKSRRRRSSG